MCTKDLVIQQAHAQSGHTRLNTAIMQAAGPGPKLLHTCSHNFTRVTIYLVVQIDLSRSEAVEAKFC